MGIIRDPVSFAEHFSLDPKVLESLGILNPVLNVDTKLFIDPVLLGRSRHEEIAARAVARFRSYFEDVIKLLAVAKLRGDVPWRAARSRLTFPEIAYTCLGYGASTIHGRAFGEQLSGHLIDTAKEIVDLGVADPDLFLLLPLLEDGVGPDLISDLTTNVISGNLAALTAVLASKLGLATETFRIGQEEYALPRNPVQPVRTPILLVPTDVLRALPVASDWSEVADAASENDTIRDRVNRLIGDIWSAKIRQNKAALRAAALSSKRAFEALLSLIQTTRARPYNLSKDPEGLLVWRQVHEAVAAEFPFALTLSGPPSRAKAIGTVQAIVGQFQTLIEKKGLWKVLWHGGNPHHEKVAQMVFFAVADAYCKANGLDVTPEAETGAGPIDFKFSAGYDVRVLVEVKLSTNAKLVAGYEKQLDAYGAAEKAVSATYLVLDVGRMGKKERQLIEARNARSGQTPEIVIVDAKPKPSASKR